MFRVAVHLADAPCGGGCPVECYACKSVNKEYIENVVNGGENGGERTEERTTEKALLGRVNEDRGNRENGEKRGNSERREEIDKVRLLVCV